MSRNSRMSFRPRSTFSVKPRTSMPSETGMVQAVSSFEPNCILWLPSSVRSNWPVSRLISGRPISTRHMRHMPTGSILGW